MNIGDKIFTDIREYKKELRAKYKDFRRTMLPEIKAQKDESIFNRIIGSAAYRDCDTLLTYVSTPIEVDTHMLIERALDDGKTVAAPRCVEGTRDMIFYEITSFDDLEVYSFGVLEPIPSRCREMYMFENALCIVPGLSFDLAGFRLGYGKGYYDRFLSSHSGLYRMGICYCGCTVNRLEHGRFDIPVNMLVTEKYAKKICKEA